MYLDLAAEFIDLNQYDLSGRTVLLTAYFACSQVDPEIPRLLLDRGAKPLLRHLETDETCLHIAIRGLSRGTRKPNEFVNCKNILKILLEAGLCITDKDRWGITPLDEARNLCFARRRIFEAALTECGIEFDSLRDDDEECPRDVHWDELPYCYCDHNRRTKF